jgi:hypothetical protein
MTILNVILIVLSIIVGIAYFSIRNARKARDKKQMKK